MQKMFKPSSVSCPERDRLFLRLLSIFGTLKLGRSQQMSIAEEAAGRKLNSLSEMSLTEIKLTLTEIGIEEAWEGYSA